MRRVDILRGKLEKLVNLLTQRKIKVTQRGTDAYVRYESKTGVIESLNVPYIPDDADEQFLDAIEGFVDHEVGHVLFTEQHHMKTAKKTPYLPNVFNAVEDSFIERKMAEKFSGSRRNLNKTAEMFTDVYTLPALEVVKDEMGRMNALFVPAIRAWGGDPFFTDFMKDKWDLIPTLVDAIGAYAKAELPKIESTKQSLAVAKNILSMIEDMMPPPEDGEGDGNDDSEDEGQEVEGGESQGQQNGDGKEQSNGKSKKSNTEKEQSDDDNQDGEGENADNGSEQKDQNGGKSKKSKDDADADSEGGDDDKDEKGQGNPNPSNASRVFSNEGEDTFADALKDKIKKQAKSLANEYSVYTTEFDMFKPPYVPERIGTQEVNALESAVSGVLGVVQKKLERAISAKSLAVWSGGYRSGKINATALSRLVVKQDDRVFKRKHITTTKDTAVSLLVDCSGSMSGNRKIRTACESAYAFSAVLERLNIKNEILGFTTGDYIANRVVRGDKSFEDFDYNCSRVERLITYQFKTFDEKLGYEQKRRLASTSNGFPNMANNVDGESLMIAANRLLVRKEARKILIVLSDGMPNAVGAVDFDKDLLKRVRYLEKETPIDLVAIGIRSEYVRKYYKHNVVLDNISELPTTCLDELQKLLLK